jgi:hypothetical protein
MVGRLARDVFGALVGRLGARPLVPSRGDGRRKARARVGGGGGGGGGSLTIASSR